MQPAGLRYYNLHEPDDLRVFPVPLAALRRWDDQRLVYDVRHGDLVLRHYAFSHYWFEVNCVLDLSGAFVPEHGPIDWSFNCACAPRASPAATMCTPSTSGSTCWSALMGGSTS